ncbi:beta-1,3-glucanase [Gloeopeniophorella convolvens]|nr:beta-1,3-glucanase [Gloeopeniophorella convolvens]
MLRNVLSQRLSCVNPEPRSSLCWSGYARASSARRLPSPITHLGEWPGLAVLTPARRRHGCARRSLLAADHRASRHVGIRPQRLSGIPQCEGLWATGDGVTDDTAAINAAISAGGRCGEGCASSSTTPATVFFPQGTYVISNPIVLFYYTELVGDAKNPPTLLASPTFTGLAVVDADPYGANGNFWISDDNFYKSVRNFVIDVTAVPAASSATGIHWQVSQATSLYNIVVNMSTENGNNHQGIFMEDGSGGFMGDLVFNGGKFGIWVGNQQFTVRNITVNNADTAIFGLWNWGWTFQGVAINDCQVGFNLTTGSPSGSPQGVEAEAIIDATVKNTPVFISSSASTNGSLDGSLVLNNIQLSNVSTVVGVLGGDAVVNGTAGKMTIDSWAQGNVFTGTNGAARFVQGEIASIPKARSLLSNGKIVSKGRPTYADYAVSQIVSVKSEGAKGDGQTDDTAALQAVFDKFAGCKIIYFDQGTYIVSSTLKIPAGVHIVGEAWSNVMGSGSAFADQDRPNVVVQVGAPGSSGVAEISGMLFTTRAPAGGAIVVEWNVRDPANQPAAAGTWDTLIRLGGTAGTNVQTTQCAWNLTDASVDACSVAFMGIHITPRASAYLEGLWVWLADHDVDGAGAQITAYSGRGIFSESQGPVWMIGTASEHHVLYQYHLADAADHYIGLAQTETPYFQPAPPPPAPFVPSKAYKDPVFDGNVTSAWALHVQSSRDVLVFGAGFYSFFQNYTTTCETTFDCQQQIVSVDAASSASLYSVSTVESVSQLSVGGRPVVLAGANPNGFAQTFTAWTRH